MRELVTIDLRDLYSRRQAEPCKQQSGHRTILTNEQEWFLWSLKDHSTQRQLSADMHISRDKIQETIKRLTEQGGPQGKRPEWI